MRSPWTFAAATAGLTMLLSAVFLLPGPMAGAEKAAGNLVEALEALKSVGPMGEGHSKAAEAWQVVAAADAGELTAILAALDDAGPLAANWIRAAADAVAERHLRESGKLPADALERFVLDSDHSPRGRRMAFEWLARVDAAAPDRLIPAFLHDPSVEFRRDAVARLLDDAASAMAGAETNRGRAEEAIAIYQKALSGARDLDQVQQIADALAKLGSSVDLATHFGFLMQWKLIGPFDNTGEQGFHVVYPPEQAIDPTAEYEGKPADGQPRRVGWIDYTTQDQFGTLDLNQALGKANGVVAYAVAEFDSDRGQEVDFRIGSSNGCKLWLNGELLGEYEVYHSGGSMDQYISRGTLAPGRNQILLKVCQNEQTEEWAQSWGFQLRVCDRAGTAILSRDRKTAKE